MRIVIVGGGAAGLVAAWSLAAEHQVWLLEAEPMLGGNIRTVGRNVQANVRPERTEGLFLDAGVVEFPRPWFPTFHALMAALAVPLVEVPGTSACFTLNGRQHLSPQAIVHTPRAPGWKVRQLGALLPLLEERKQFLLRSHGLSVAQLYDQRLVDFVSPGDLRTWLRLLCTYAWSIPLEQVDDIPAALAVPVMRHIVSSIAWSAVVGGAYAYVEKIEQQLAADGAVVRTACPVARITRDADGVRVTLANREQLQCDAVVLAVTPDRVAGLLADADAMETRWFAEWKGNDAHTVLHLDTGLYRRRDVTWFSEFDVFQTGPDTGGYNAYLNRLNQVPAERGDFSLALGMEHEVDPACVVHRQAHHSPRYTAAALAHRPDVQQNQGHRSTWYAGAWLGDGLHEGAVASGLALGAVLGGRAVVPQG